MNALLTYICSTQDFLGGKIQKKFLDKIIETLQTTPVDKTMIEIRFVHKLEGKFIEHK